MTQNASSPKLVAVAAAILIVAFSIYLLIVGESIFIPLVMAIFITYLLTALAHALQRIRIRRRSLPHGLALAAAIVLLLLVLTLLAQFIAGNIRAVIEAAPTYQARFQDVLDRLMAVAARTFNDGQPIGIAEVLREIDLAAITTRLAGVFQAFASNTFQIVVYVAFLLLELRTFDRKLDAMVANESRRATVRATLREIGDKIERYVLVKTLVSFVTGLVSLIVLTAIDVDFAPFWALLAFVLNFVPYVGSLIAIVLPALFALLQFGEPSKALLTAAVLWAVQLPIDNVIEPRLAGRSLNLSPVAIMLGLSVWGTMWGVIGMILSVPIMVMVMIVLSQFPQTRPFAVLMSERGELR